MVHSYPVARDRNEQKQEIESRTEYCTIHIPSNGTDVMISFQPHLSTTPHYAFGLVKSGKAVEPGANLQWKSSLDPAVKSNDWYILNYYSYDRFTVELNFLMKIPRFNPSS